MKDDDDETNVGGVDAYLDNQVCIQSNRSMKYHHHLLWVYLNEEKNQFTIL